MRRHIAAMLGATAIIVVALGGAAVGQAATTQDVTATLACQPGTMKPPASVGCTLTVTNNGNNAANDTSVTVAATGGTFVSTTDGRCTGVGTSTLTCQIGKLAGGETFSELHELDVPSSTLRQTATGHFSSPKGNARGTYTIPCTNCPYDTSANESGDFDGTYANDAGDFVNTDPRSDTNFYSTTVTVTGTDFGSGLTIEDDVDAGEANPNCPADGCFHGKILRLSIDPLTAYPDTFTMTITVEVPRGTQTIELRHDGNLVEDVSYTIDPRTSVARILVTRPGDDNGDWGTG